MNPKAKYGEAKATIDGAIGCDDTESCIPWLFSTNHNGQPAAFVDGRGIAVRRYVYSKSRGMPEEDLRVTTTCGDPRCVNPHHMKQETHPKVLRGINAKLTDDDVREIRQLHGQGLSQCKIAERFNVSPASISLILSGKTWRHV